MADNKTPAPLAELFAKLSRKPKGDCRYIRGCVSFSEILADIGVVVVHIKNGSKEDRFWAPIESQTDFGKPVCAPMIGEWVEGYLDPFEDSVDINGEKSQAIFDLENKTRNAEEEAFAWFSAHPKGPPWLATP